MNVYIKCVLIIAFGLFLSCFAHKNVSREGYANTNPKSLTAKVVNGLWLDGDSFRPKTVWIESGILSFEQISQAVDTVIDLQGLYIIPPFAEAHNHNLESNYEIQKRIDAYLGNGVFYVKLLSTIKKRIEPLMQYYNKPEGIDVSMAHAPLTGTDGHPIGVRKRYLERGYFKGLFNSIEELESHGYYVIDNIDDLEKKWKQILSFSPDFIKIMLLHSEEYAERKNDMGYYAMKGLDPALVPMIVKRAHGNNLRVSAHVETAHDFHVAVTAGVDEIAHLPEIKNGKLIDINDALTAREKDIVVVTTASLITKRSELPEYQELINVMKENLLILKEAKVSLAIGSDMYSDNSTEEMAFLKKLGVFTNEELLKMWCVNAPQTIFPNRKIGFLKDGYEASFLALDKNPLVDMQDIQEHIVFKMKQGVLLKE